MTLSEFIKSINRREWLIVFFVWLATVLLSLLPFLFAWSHVKDGFVISGLHALAYGDMNVYLSYLHQVMDGHYLLQTLFTSESGLAMFRPDWLAFGLIGKLLHLTPLVTYHVTRILMSGFLLSWLYVFLKYFFIDKKKTGLVFLTVSFATGMGMWLLPILRLLVSGYKSTLFWPIDMWVSEAFIFLSNWYSPHFVFSWLLLLSVYLFWLFICQPDLPGKKVIIYSWLAGFSCLILFISHPFHILPVFFIMAVHYITIFFSSRKQAVRLFIPIATIFVLALLGVLYHLYYLSHDWLTAVKALQNVTTSPNLAMVIFGFGAVIPILAGWQIYKEVKSGGLKKIKNSFIVVWFVLQLILVYTPVLWQRRMLQGWQVPMIILFWWWLFPYLEKFKSDKRQYFNKILLWIFILFFTILPSTFYNIIRDSIYYSQGQQYFYYSHDYYNGMLELRKLDDDARILSSPTSANYIVGVTGKKIFMAHGVETAYAAAKQGLVELFFKDNKNNDKKYSWLQQYGITHIFYSQLEKDLGNFNPANKDYLELVYENKEIKIYQVKLSEF